MATAFTIDPTKSGANYGRLPLAFLLAIILHTIILSIKFIAHAPKPATKNIEVTLVTIKSPAPPKRAHILAQEHQISSGQKNLKPGPPKQKMSSSSPPEIEHKAPVKKPEPKPVKAAAPPKVVEKPRIIAKRVDSAPPLPISTPPHQYPVVAPAPHPTPLIEPTPRPQLSPETLRMQITQLGARLAQHEHQEAPSRIKSLNSINTHKYVAAQYISDWERKVERMGNLNYPEAARKQNLNGHLTMEVHIKADGSIANLHIGKSSGHKVLDEAAKKIVRMSAPFPPLPKALLNELSELKITRVWSFSDESGMTAR